MERAYYQSCIQDVLSRRCQKNPRYSLRAFARSIGFEPTVISQVISGKRVPSAKSAQRLIQALDLSPEEKQHFLCSLAEVHRGRAMKRFSPYFKSFKTVPVPPRELSLDIFRIIADWYHYAILALTTTDQFQSDSRWIANRLGISETEVKLAIDRLEQLGLLKMENGKWIAGDGGFTTADKHLTNSALRRRQRQILEKSIESLENDPIEKRSHTAMTMAIDPEKLPEAKRRIQAFTQELSGFLESGKRKAIYEVGISLFPLERETERKGN